MANYSDIAEARKQNQGKVIVWYLFSLGGQLADRRMWCSELNGEVIDYDDKQVLVDGALEAGDKVVVLTLRRNGTVAAKEVVR